MLTLIRPFRPPSPKGRRTRLQCSLIQTQCNSRFCLLLDQSNRFPLQQGSIAPKNLSFTIFLSDPLDSDEVVTDCLSNELRAVHWCSLRCGRCTINALQNIFF